MQESLVKLSEFIKQPVTAAITFNNLAFNMELTEGETAREGKVSFRAFRRGIISISF